MKKKNNDRKQCALAFLTQTRQDSPNYNSNQPLITSTFTHFVSKSIIFKQDSPHQQVLLNTLCEKVYFSNKIHLTITLISH